MTKKDFQFVVDFVDSQSDCYYDFIKDPTTLASDKEHLMEEFRSVCAFLKEARDKGFKVENNLYPLEKKLQLIKEE